MIEKDTGGTAFPCDSNTARAWAVFENAKKPLSESDYLALIDGLQAGMTTRDYFAAKAMQGLLSSGIQCGPEYVQSIADSAYIVADAMLKARKS